MKVKKRFISKILFFLNQKLDLNYKLILGGSNDLPNKVQSLLFVNKRKIIFYWSCKQSKVKIYFILTAAQSLLTKTFFAVRLARQVKQKRKLKISFSVFLCTPNCTQKIACSSDRVFTITSKRLLGSLQKRIYDIYESFMYCFSIGK